MDKIPLQTLKNVEKVTSEDKVLNISQEINAVLRNFKPTVRSRREFEPDDSCEFDTAFEKELNRIESDVNSFHLKETLPKIEAELGLWTHEYKTLLDEFSKFHEDSIQDQAVLRESEFKIQEKLNRVAIVENIKTSLLTEVTKLCLLLEKTKYESKEKLHRNANNFNDIIHYLNRGFDKERISYQATVELLRKLEHTLRDTCNKYENAKANIEVLQDELKQTKKQLHSTQRELQEEKWESHKSKTLIQQYKIDLEDASERKESAEKTLSKYLRNFK